MTALTRPQLAAWGASFACAMAWVAFQVWLLPLRWLNPDEGAHLMDARLAMEGLVPLVDYGARQPLYVYAYVPFLKYFGMDYLSGRLMPMAATLLAAGILYAIGRRVAGWGVGLASALWYLSSPTMLVDAPVVKTEPLAIVVMALGMYALLAHLERGRWLPLALSGAAFGAGYYIRESTLAGALTAALMALAAAGRDGWVRTVKRWVVLTAGYAATCAAVMLWYSRRLPLAEILVNSAFSPFFRVMKSLQRIAGWWPSAPAIEPSAPSAASAISAVSAWTGETSLPLKSVVRNLQEVLLLNAPLVFGLIAGIVLLVWLSRKHPGRKDSAGERTGLLLAILWVVSLAVLYTYHALTKSFYQFYFREFIPPLALALALVLRRLAPEAHRDAALVGMTVCGIAAGLGVFVLQRLWPNHGAWHAAALVGAAGWASFRSTRPRPQAVVRFLGLGSIGAALVAAMTLGARALKPAYDCVWSPEALQRVTEMVRQHSAESDEVISGAVIWEFEAGRRPFMNISHPLAYLYEMDRGTIEGILQRLAANPPKLVVMDGYTERTYLRHLPQLQTLVDTRYTLVGEATDSKRPVRVYVLAGAGSLAAKSSE